MTIIFENTNWNLHRNEAKSGATRKGFGEIEDVMVARGFHKEASIERRK